jgi:NTE family protein
MINWLRRILTGQSEEVSDLKLGLALGGGGVRGFAHVGVLRVLDGAGIPVDAIAGTSIGAIIGGVYALNPDFGAAPLVKEIMDLGLSVPVSMESSPGDSESFVERLREFVQTERFLVDTLWGWGVFPDKAITEALKRVTLGKSLEEARIPVAVVAVDLLSGERVVFTEGSATMALRASSAIPGFIPPLRHTGQLLADGALVDEVPTDVVREMGMDLVVAVDVSQEGKHVQIHNGLEAFLRAVELGALARERHYVRDSDYIIHPEFEQPVFALDFSKAELCVEAGARAAQRALPEIIDLLKR